MLNILQHVHILQFITLQYEDKGSIIITGRSDNNFCPYILLDQKRTKLAIYQTGGTYLGSDKLKIK